MSTNGDDEFRVPLPRQEVICPDCHGLTGRRETCGRCQGAGLIVPAPREWYNAWGRKCRKPGRPFIWKSRGPGHRWACNDEAT